MVPKRVTKPLVNYGEGTVFVMAFLDTNPHGNLPSLCFPSELKMLQALHTRVVSPAKSRSTSTCFLCLVVNRLLVSGRFLPAITRKGHPKQYWLAPGTPRNYPIRFALKLVQLQPLLVKDKYRSCRSFCSGPQQVVDILKTLDYENQWEEAQLGDVIKYVRGARSLQVPPEYKVWLPTTING